MKMTKLGISSGLLSAICYFFGYINLWVATALMVTVLILGLDSTVKRNAIQAVVTFGSLAMIRYIYDELIFIINRVGDIGYNEVSYWILKTYGWFLLLFALYAIYNALKEKIVFIPVVSGFVNKNIDVIE